METAVITKREEACCRPWEVGIASFREGKKEIRSDYLLIQRKFPASEEAGALTENFSCSTNNRASYDGQKKKEIRF